MGCFAIQSLCPRHGQAGRASARGSQAGRAGAGRRRVLGAGCAARCWALGARQGRRRAGGRAGGLAGGRAGARGARCKGGRGVRQGSAAQALGARPVCT